MSFLATNTDMKREALFSLLFVADLYEERA
jgi:hypothetical protein